MQTGRSAVALVTTTAAMTTPTKRHREISFLRRKGELVSDPRITQGGRLRVAVGAPTLRLLPSASRRRFGKGRGRRVGAGA